jgi:beta-galactosidase
VASLDVASQVAPDIDVIAMIAYRGPGFGNLFRQVKEKFDRPVAMTEWGADSFNAARREEDETSQAEFLKLQWQDIERNALGKKGVGNAIGGTLFEWSDEWWKGNENIPHTWAVHDEAGHWQNASYHYDAYGADKMNMNEEWWGVVKLDPKRRQGGLNERVPKEAYQTLKELWNKS